MERAPYGAICGPGERRPVAAAGARAPSPRRVQSSRSGRPLEPPHGAVWHPPRIPQPGFACDRTLRQSPGCPVRSAGPMAGAHRLTVIRDRQFPVPGVRGRPNCVIRWLPLVEGRSLGCSGISVWQIGHTAGRSRARFPTPGPSLAGSLRRCGNRPRRRVVCRLLLPELPAHHVGVLQRLFLARETLQPDHRRGGAFGRCEPQYRKGRHHFSSSYGDTARARRLSTNSPADLGAAAQPDAGQVAGRWGATIRPSGSRSPVSSNTTTPLHSRLHPCSGWAATT